MDAIKRLLEANSKDIIISLPKDKTWDEYLEHFEDLEKSEGIVKIIVQQVPKTGTDNKCFIIFDGFLRGWLHILRLTETFDGEVCVELLPRFTASHKQAPMAEIDDFKYYLDNFEMQ